jgi:hypothetical protein
MGKKLRSGLMKWGDVRVGAAKGNLM